jgi:hypothetical protein
MKNSMYLFVGIVLALALVANAEYYANVSAVKQADGSWQITMPLNDYQSNSKNPKIGETIEFGSKVYVCASVTILQNGKWSSLKQGNHMLVTNVDWTRYVATGTLVLPGNVEKFKIHVWGYAPGQANAISNCVYINDKDPAAVRNPDLAYELECDVNTGTAKPVRG